MFEILQAKDKHNAATVADENSAARLANYVLAEARTLRTKDNTSIIFLDFVTMRTNLRYIHS